MIMMALLKQDDLAKLLLRVGLGGMMLLHGIAKIGATGSMLFIKGALMAKGLPEILYYGVFIGEIIAPVLLIVGFQSRIAGLVIAVNMVFAVYLVHMGELFALTSHGGWKLELQAFYLLGGLCVAFLGSGKFAFKPD